MFKPKTTAIQTRTLPPPKTTTNKQNKHTNNKRWRPSLICDDHVGCCGDLRQTYEQSDWLQFLLALSDLLAKFANILSPEDLKCFSTRKLVQTLEGRWSDYYAWTCVSLKGDSCWEFTAEMSQSRSNRELELTLLYAIVQWEMKQEIGKLNRNKRPHFLPVSLHREHSGSQIF